MRRAEQDPETLPKPVRVLHVAPQHQPLPKCNLEWIVASLPALEAEAQRVLLAGFAIRAIVREAKPAARPMFKR